MYIAKRNNKGITLIALVITIIVLLILVGISMNLLLGENGIIKRTDEVKFKTKMSSIAEEVILHMGVEIIEGNETKLYAGEILKNIVIDEELELSENMVQNIKNISKSITSTEEQYVMIYEGELYYVSQSKIKNNEQQTKWCEEIGIKIWQYEPPTGIKVVNGNYEYVNEVYMCTPKLTTGFNKETTRYAKQNGDVMVPGNWLNKKPDEDWYDYNGDDETGENVKWANIYVETNGLESYYVWIPRYVYKIDEVKSERMDVKFVDLYNNYIDDNGNKTNWDELQLDGYKLPEAFWWDNDGDRSRREWRAITRILD